MYAKKLLFFFLLTVSSRSYSMGLSLGEMMYCSKHGLSFDSYRQQKKREEQKKKELQIQQSTKKSPAAQLAARMRNLRNRRNKLKKKRFKLKMAQIQAKPN